MCNFHCCSCPIFFANSGTLAGDSGANATLQAIALLLVPVAVVWLGEPVTPALLVKGLLWSLGIGFVGGLAPALHAARIPVTEALRAR